MLYGLDYLGGARYKDVVINAHPTGFAAGFFTKVDGFGDSLPVVDALLATGKCPRVRLHLMWKDGHDYNDKDIAYVVAETKRVAPLMDKYPNVEFRISPCCEHKNGLGEAQKFITAISPFSGRAYLVNSIEPGGAIIAGMINEFHGAFSRPPTGGRIDFSFDGTPCVDADVESYKTRYSHAETFYLWDSRFNGNYDGQSLPRPQRKGWPDVTLINSIAHLSGPKGATSLPANWIFKSHSENKGNNDIRAEKPVMITPVNAKTIELRARTGQVIDTLSYYGTFTDGRFRYYAKNWGFQSADKAVQIQGDALCDVVINGKKYGVVNPAFRSGEYR